VNFTGSLFRLQKPNHVSHLCRRDMMSARHNPLQPQREKVRCTNYTLLNTPHDQVQWNCAGWKRKRYLLNEQSSYVQAGTESVIKAEAAVYTGRNFIRIYTKVTGWNWSLYRLLPRFVLRYTEVYTGIYWGLCLVTQFTQADTEDSAELTGYTGW
jgi:hypothetical protein